MWEFDDYKISVPKLTEEQKQVITPAALKFIKDLSGLLDDERLLLLAARHRKQYDFDTGYLPNFLDKTKEIRSGEWTVAPIPSDLKTRTVEITGPASERKMVINALNSGANCYMADFEDSMAPNWDNAINGQINVRDAVNKTIYLNSFGKEYKLNDKIAKLLVRPRGLHLYENNMLIDGLPVSASIFDAGLFFFHNADRLVKDGQTIAFYIPKMESHEEARWWARLFRAMEDSFLMQRGSIRATVLVETLPAIFETHEILWELKDYACGLNAGRWDYLYSFIKTLNAHKDRVLPNKSELTMSQHFLLSYCKVIVATCLKRGATPMGGMSALLPIKGDEIANIKARGKIFTDKTIELSLGFKGAWVAHPDLVSLVETAFCKEPEKPRDLMAGLNITAEDLLAVPNGHKTYVELCSTISSCLQYMYHWLSGKGAVAINNLMEDLATFEIGRAQIKNWLKHGVELDGFELDQKMLDAAIEEEIKKLSTTMQLDLLKQAATCLLK